MKVDLHIHTNASDGRWTPERLIAELKNTGIGLFSVTDHDTVANIAPAAKLAAEAGLRFIPGVEISATLRGRLYHILGYGIDPENAGLLDLLRYNDALMVKNDDKSIKRLIELGYEIDYSAYLAYENDTTRGGWKALNFLIDVGLCADMGEFFSKLFKDEPAPYPVFPHPEAIIPTIIGAGGIPVLAHPGGSVNRNSNLEKALAIFTELGIEGLESFHPEHDAEKTQTCLKWAAKNGIEITGGSDCHGGFIASRRLGWPDILYDQLRMRRLVERI